MTRQSEPHGSITVICGSMFSGKTEELIRLVRRAMHARKSIQVFKSALETRCDTTVIRTHDGISFNAMAVADTRALERLLAPDVQLVAIEEVQFFDEPIVGLCQWLANRGVEVIVAGLDQDFRGQPFGFMPTLMSLAENVLKLHAICKVCGGEACRTQRLVDGRPAAWDEPTILIGADERYEARCRRCHRIRKVPTHLRAVVNPTDRSSLSASDRTRPLGPRRERNGTNGHKEASTATAPPGDGTQLEMFPETVTASEG